MAAGDAERRYVVGSGWQTVAVSASGTVTAGDVDSDGAANGEVLTADGGGGASWEVGGGGSLPAWWTVDSTPGSESVEFAGSVGVEPTDPTQLPQGAHYVVLPVGSLAEGAFGYWLERAEGGDYPFRVDVYGNASFVAAATGDGGGGGITLRQNDGTVIVNALADDGSGIGSLELGDASTLIAFFGGSTVAQPTGVAVDTAAIHAALVDLGLITA